MKRLGFKSILARFDADHMAAPDVASISRSSGILDQAEEIFAKAEKEKIWGCS